MQTEKFVTLINIGSYNVNEIFQSLDDSLFRIIRPNDIVVLKPNWVKESHIQKPNDWDYIITHPDVITAVLWRVIEKLGKGGKIIITDGPQTDSSFQKIISRYPIEYWMQITCEKDIELQIIDLRDDEWLNEGGVIIDRKKLPGDPKGKVEVNLLNDLSEFYQHQKSKRGYYGADYNIEETNKAHDGENNIYSVSRSVIEADVFINLPKLKTHKKAGITCCLKNLVGINTYKNYLPHHSEGNPSQNGDQFKDERIGTKIEGPVVSFIKQNILKSSIGVKIMKPFVKTGFKIFGKTEQTIRSGNWYGNDTLWRMILDLNKVLFYANTDGTLKKDKWINCKSYIGIVDAIYVGEGNGPLAPDKVIMNKLIMGNNPVAIDTVCAELMGFDYNKIPSIRNSYNIKKFSLCNFQADEIVIKHNNEEYSLKNLPNYLKMYIKPHFGWFGQIEKSITIH